MKRFLVALVAVGVVVSAVAVSRSQKAVPNLELQIKQEDRNPWTNLRLNNDPADFQFAIVSDRTGGHRAGVFSKAVEELNLMQPEFVLSVGDLIEGYKKDTGRLGDEWKEFQGYIAKLQMPFFYCVGNHDVSVPSLQQIWKEKFGRRYFHFVYKEVLFLVLDSDDPFGDPGHVSESQVQYFKQALEENANVRWTIVALHRPLWAVSNVEKTGFLEFEKLLAGRPYTVFAGHVHRYQKFVRNGQNYYQLATTGGASKVRGVSYGEFDHIVWVTMKKNGPVMANILLDGIYPEDMKQPTSDETGTIIPNRRATYAVRGKVYFDGSPTPGAQVAFYALSVADKKMVRTGDAFVEPDGTFRLSSYVANDGAPAGEYAVTVVWRQPWLDAGGKPGPNLLPDRYSKPETTDLRAKVIDGVNEFAFELKK